jgi:thioredoxin reductase
MNYRLDEGHTLKDLKSQGYHAILIAAGASLSKALNIENPELDGVYPGLVLLKSARLSQKPRLEGQIVVVGGGNVAIDAAMTAIRLGARTVRLYCLESRAEMPAHEWEIRQAEEEGVEIYPSWGPAQFKSANGRISGIEFKRCTRVFDSKGKFDPQYDESEVVYVEANSVIITVGQEVDPELFSLANDSQKGPGNILKVDENFALGFEGLFAAGDVIRGPSSVVDAIADGRLVAGKIDKFLGGNGLIDADAEDTIVGATELKIPSDQFRHNRYEAEIADPEERKSGFELIRQTLSEKASRQEAQRCLRCNLRQKITPVVLPPELWQPFNDEVVDSVPDVEGVIQLFDSEKKVIKIMGTSNIQQALKECLENPGDAGWFIWEEDPMYTKRESELIQRHLQKYGELPGGGGGDDDLDDLF